MSKNYYKPNLLKIKFFYLITLLFIWGINSHCLEPPSGTITLPSGMIINIILAKSITTQNRGLSHIASSDFPKTSGMLFIYKSWGAKRFWMPDTYFNLDIIFLDPNLNILYIEKNMPAHPGMKNSPPIKYTKTVKSFHILEVRSDAKLTDNLKVGDNLKWKGRGFTLQKE